MSQPQSHETTDEHGVNAIGPDGKPKPKIHRVCIGCNNMFEVTMDNYEAKHCPVCHKG